MQWFEIPGPGFMAFHVANSWDEPNGDVKVGGDLVNGVAAIVVIVVVAAVSYWRGWASDLHRLPGG